VVAKRHKVGYITPRMELPCEHASRAVIPSIRAVVAKVMVEDFGLSRYTVAKLLDVTPAAITNYLKHKRGEKYVDEILNNEQLMKLVHEIAKTLIEGNGVRDIRVYTRYKNLVCQICHEVNVYAKEFGCNPANANGSQCLLAPGFFI